MIPNLPTDNLYKFYALTGLALIGFGAFIVLTVLDELSEKVSVSKMMMKQAQIEADYWTVLGTRDEDTINRALGKTQDVDDGRLSVPITAKELRDRDEARFEARKNVKLKVAEMEQRNERERELLQRFWGILVLCGAAMLGGLSLSQYGFRQWKKIQLLQDKILRAAAAKLD